MTKTKETRSFIETILCMGIITPPLFLFSLVADLPHVMVITLGALFLSLISRKAVKLSDRTIIYSIVVSFVAAILFDLAFPLADDRFEYISSLFRPNITVPVILYMAVAVTFFGVKRYSYGISALAGVVALAFASNAMRIPFETERFIVPEILLNNFRTLYIVCICLSMFFIMLSCRNNVQEPIDRKMRKYSSRRFLIIIFIIVLVFPAGYGSYQLFLYFENDIRGLQNVLLNPMFFKNRGGKTIFGEKADLNQIISPELMKNQEAIVLRAISKDEPGYLRGRTYTTYAAGQWRQTKDPQQFTMRLRDSEGKDYRTFSINARAKSKHSIEILVSSKLVSKVLFLPGNFTQIDIIANSLRYTANGNVNLADWITDGGYTIYRSKGISDSSWPKPLKPAPSIYTQLPDNLIKEMDKILAGLPKLKTARNDQQRIAILLKYFQDNFEYKIREQPVNPVDPVLSFLKTTQEGHCELYATSMILLLRRVGIPARYITGFVCAEPHPMGYYYVARVGNAHAWVEAFDREKSKWLLVEPTPASGAPNYKHEWSTVESWIDIIKKAFQQLLSDMRRGYFAQAIIGFFAAIWQFIALLFWHSVRGPILTLILIALTVRYVRRWRKRRVLKSDFATPDEMLVELSKAYHKIQKQLTKKYELEVSMSSTINDFIVELSKSEMPELQKISLIKLLRKYEAMRYKKTLPTQEVYQDFKKHFHL